MSFSYDLTTNVGKLRLQIGDTHPTKGVKPNGTPFEDEELNTFLTQEGALVPATALAIEVLARMYARAVDTSAGELQQSLGQIAARYETEGTKLRSLANQMGVGSGSTATSGVALLNIRWLAEKVEQSTNTLGQHEF